MIVLLILLLFFPLISAIELDMKTEFSQGETLMAKVSGNFINPLQKSNIFFYKEHVRIPVGYDIKQINEDYYIYAILIGKEPRNYSIALENIRYIEEGKMSEEDIRKNFTINNQMADFSINPGFASGTEFSIGVQNLRDNDITVGITTSSDVNISEESYLASITLKSGEKQYADFIFKSQEPIFKIIELSTENLKYEVPVFIPATETTPPAPPPTPPTPPEEITEPTEEETFKFEPDELIISTPTNENITKTIYLYNTGDEAIENITVSLSYSLKNYVNISKESIDVLDANSNVPIELTFFSEEEFELDGHIKARQGEKIIYSVISVKFLEGYIPPPEEPTPQEHTTKTCAELGYAVCSGNEECSSDDVVYAKDDVCCTGTCKAKEETGSTGRIIGIAILIIVIIVVFWFYKKKYKGTKKPTNLLKITGLKKK